MKRLVFIFSTLALLQAHAFFDTDDDGLDDAWELSYFPTLETTTGAENSDTDGLDNFAEQAAGTDPTSADTDEDGLEDHVESDNGTYDSPADTGTNPLAPDTDGDGLLDGEEISTNPNLEDSDNDGFNDRVEIERNTKPNSSGDKPPGQLPLEISEILASNETGLEDGNGRRSDWIEIYNPNFSTVVLTGYHLTDNPSNLTKWTFPATTIAARTRIVIFTTGDDMTDPAGNRHTNFRLSGSGEYLALVKPDSSEIDDVIRPGYPEQFNDVSYGRPSSGGGRIFFATPTPNSANSASGSLGVVKDTNFSIDRGFYDTPFDLAITSATPNSTIRYTLDGSLPSLSNGSTYTAPIPISTTTNVRAIAYLEAENYLPTNVDTHTYIFVNDVGSQNASDLIVQGWAPNWGYDSQVGRVIPADYDMDPRVVNDDLNQRELGYTMRDALLDIPTVSLSLKQTDFVQTRPGTSTFPRSLYGTPRERDFEPVCSVEYILPDGSRGFQEDCKVETHGNSSRTPSRMQKHSLRLTFSTTVGTGKLRYNLFPDSPIDEFNKLVLRACFTDSWGLASWSAARYRPNDSLYTRDVWMKNLFGNMGQPTSHGNFVHLYVNGAYFGMHNLTERIEDDFYADHQGGEKEDWEVNADLLTPGPLWNSMLSTLNGAITTPAVYETAKTKIDVANYADWVILHLYADSEDWPNKNAYAAANAISGDGRYRFNVWDQEIAFDKYSWNRYNDNRNGMRPFQRLRLNVDFQTLFADRVYKHLHDGGALTMENTTEELLEINGLIDKAIIAESARWGDVQATTPYGSSVQSSTNIDNDAYPPAINNPPYFTREQHWIVEQENLVTNYIPTLHDLDDSRSFIRELRSRNLYPSIDPPVFSKLGGVVPADFPLQLTAPDGAVYFTTNKSDPRLNGGTINPEARSFGGLLEEEVIGINDFGWTYLAGTTGQSASNIIFGNGSYNSGDWKHPSFDDTTWAPNAADSPEGAQGPFSGRTSTAIQGIAQPNTLLDIGPFGRAYPTVYFRKYFDITKPDEVVDLNFNFIRDDAVIIYLNGREIYRDAFPIQIVNYSDFGPSDSESIPVEFTHTLAPGELLEGENILAIELHNLRAGDSDLGLQLFMNSRRQGPEGNVINLTETGTIKARTLFNGEWSALREADFIVGTPAGTGNLVVSEIMYNPQGANELLEFIELLNIHPELSLDLTNVAFTDGILYTFPPGVTLPPLSHIVIAKDRDSFIATYGDPGSALAPGSFENSLSNSGESLDLVANDGALIQSFTYDDELESGWPTSPDGLGPSLVLITPLSDPDHALSSNWTASRNSAGSPGEAEKGIPENPDEDNDKDGLTNLAEYFFGTNPMVVDVNPVSIGSGPNGLTLTFDRDPQATVVDWELQSSDDLKNWTSIDSDPLEPTPAVNGLQSEMIEITLSESLKFYRIRIMPSP